LVRCFGLLQGFLAGGLDPFALPHHLLFGGRKLPELARAMGTSITQFKKGLSEADEDAKRVGEAKEGEAE